MIELPTAAIKHQMDTVSNFMNTCTFTADGANFSSSCMDRMDICFVRTKTKLCEVVTTPTDYTIDVVDALKGVKALTGDTIKLDVIDHIYTITDEKCTLKLPRILYPDSKCVREPSIAFDHIVTIDTKEFVKAIGVANSYMDYLDVYVAEDGIIITNDSVDYGIACDISNQDKIGTTVTLLGSYMSMICGCLKAYDTITLGVREETPLMIGGKCDSHMTEFVLAPKIGDND